MFHFFYSRASPSNKKNGSSCFLSAVVPPGRWVFKYCVLAPKFVGRGLFFVCHSCDCYCGFAKLPAVEHGKVALIIAWRTIIRAPRSSSAFGLQDCSGRISWAGKKTFAHKFSAYR